MMNYLLSLTLLISSLLFAQPSIADICVNTSSNNKVFGSALMAEVLMLDHELAFHNNNFLDYQFFPPANSNAQLEQQVRQMAASGSCSIMIGFFSSRDCLIAGPILKKNKIIGISPTCNDDHIHQFSPYLYTALPSMGKFSANIANYLNKTNLAKIIVIYQPTDIYSITGYTQFKKKWAKPIIEVPVGRAGELDLGKFTYKKGEPVTMVFFTYPLPSAQLFMTLANHQLLTKDVSIVGNTSWGANLSLFKPIKPILEQAKVVIIPDVVDWKKARHSALVKQFVRKFHREPTTDELLIYDITQLSIQCYKKSLLNYKYHTDRFQDCITQIPYQGISGVFSFSKQLPFADRQIYLNNFLERM